jgi:hypothetical protein
MSNKQLTYLWGVIMVANAYSTFIFHATTFWLVWGLGFFALSAFRFAQCISRWNGSEE